MPTALFPAGMANFHVLDDLEEQPSADHTTAATPVPARLLVRTAPLRCSQHYCGPHLCSTECRVKHSESHVDAVLERLTAKFGRPQRRWGRRARSAGWAWNWRPENAGPDQIYGAITLLSKGHDTKGGNGITVLFDSSDGYPMKLPGICSCVQYYL